VTKTIVGPKGHRHMHAKYTSPQMSTLAKWKSTSREDSSKDIYTTRTMLLHYTVFLLDE